MTKQALLRGLVGMTALLVLGGCSKETKSETAADVDRGDPVTVLEAGAEPRTPLRYKITDGTVTKSNMDFRLATLAQTADAAALSVVPGVRLHIVSGPTMRTEAGIEFGVNIKKAEAMVPEGLDEETAEALRESASILDRVGGTVVINDRGLIQSTKLNEQAKNPNLPLRLLVMIVNARTTLSRVVLPAEPVGLGARWESSKEVILYGFKIHQVDTYTLVEKVGDEIKLNVAVTQNALPQTLDFPDDGVSISVESMTANASGEIILNLNALESDAAAAGDSTDKMTVTAGDQTEKIDVSETFEIQMTNTTAFE